MQRNNTGSDHAPQMDVNEIGGEVVVALSGCIDIDFAPVLRQRLLSILQGRSSRGVSIDFSKITHIDSSGIATLIEALKIARVKGTVLKLDGLPDRLLRLLEVTGILSMFNAQDTRLDQARQRAV